jgi:TnpA family transposase
MDLHSTTQDQSTLEALALIMGHRRSRKQTLDAVNANGEPIDLSWIPEKWLKLVTGKTIRNRNSTEVQRSYFELCLFTTLAQELKSGDVVIMGSDKFGDFRDQLVSWEEYNEQIAEYGELAGITTDPKALIAELKRWLQSSAKDTDKKFPGNDQVRVENGELVIQRVKRKPIPAALERINQALDDRLAETSILDVLIDMEKWLGLSKGFKPLSGHETKLTDHQRRFIVTLFCYGCNLGPTQTARSIEGINRRQVAWLNLRHSTEEKIDEAITKVINAYNRFSLPKIWGTGQTASADGTKWNLYEQNLLSEHHLRYLGTGGLGYYHLSDTYIALFSHFIPCGVYEAVYILDGLLKNQSDIQPDTIHGDTQSQSEAVFGLAYLLGIKLMPRIRGIKHLKLYRVSKTDHYKHIDTLFKDTTNWELIESCLPDMLRIALSVKAGRINASTILRRLGTYSRKNKLYLALRELGRVVRTVFLLQYIAEAEIREMIQAATCKSEEFNDFLQWVMFGNDGLIAENIRHEQQKIIKYNHLVANMIILYNVVTMTKVLGDLADEGYPISPEVLAGTSPFRRGNINRFGTYSMNMEREVPSIEFDIPIPVADKGSRLVKN